MLIQLMLDRYSHPLQSAISEISVRPFPKVTNKQRVAANISVPVVLLLAAKTTPTLWI